MNVLLLEDDRASRYSICRYLKINGFTCLPFSDLKSAMDVVFSQSIDIVFCDIELPDGSGFELLKKIRDSLLPLPFIFITASHDEKIIPLALKKGADDFLKKPFNLENLQMIIMRNVERKKIETANRISNKESILLHAIKALVAALEAKDAYTSGHSLQVARYTHMMGEALGLFEEDLFVLELSALLHDIGKIGMPDKILKKTESLKDEEYALAKEHVVIGSKIVNEISDLKDVATIIRHHHERYDGEGYPDGLKGDAIPFFSRIITIADVYETIRAERRYSGKKTMSYAFEELIKHSGTQFDPELLELFIRMIRSTIEIKENPKLQIEEDITLDFY
jgi:putative two-component system response regulator